MEQIIIAVLVAIPATIGAVGGIISVRRGKWIYGQMNGVGPDGPTLREELDQIGKRVAWLSEKEISFQEKGWENLPPWIGDAAHLTSYLVKMGDDIKAISGKGDQISSQIDALVARLEEHEIKEFSRKYLSEEEVALIIQAELMAWMDRGE